MESGARALASTATLGPSAAFGRSESPWAGSSGARSSPVERERSGGARSAVRTGAERGDTLCTAVRRHLRGRPGDPKTQSARPFERVPAANVQGTSSSLAGTAARIISASSIGTRPTTVCRLSMTRCHCAPSRPRRRPSCSSSPRTDARARRGPHHRCSGSRSPLRGHKGRREGAHRRGYLRGYLTRRGIARCVAMAPIAHRRRRASRRTVSCPRRALVKREHRTTTHHTGQSPPRLTCDFAETARSAHHGR